MYFVVPFFFIFTGVEELLFENFHPLQSCEQTSGYCLRSVSPSRPHQNQIKSLPYIPADPPPHTHTKKTNRGKRAQARVCRGGKKSPHTRSQEIVSQEERSFSKFVQLRLSVSLCDRFFNGSIPRVTIYSPRHLSIARHTQSGRAADGETRLAANAATERPRPHNDPEKLLLPLAGKWRDGEQGALPQRRGRWSMGTSVSWIFCDGTA